MVRMPRGVRAARAAAAATSSRLQTGLPTPTRPAGRAPLRSDRRGGVDALWPGRRTQAVRGAAGVFARRHQASEGAAPGCLVGHDLAFRCGGGRCRPCAGSRRLAGGGDKDTREAESHSPTCRRLSH